MATEPTMYQFELTHWDGIPASDGCLPGMGDFYQFLDAAWARIGRLPIDATNDRALLQRVVDAIRPNERGIKPRVRVIPYRGW